MGKRLTIIGVTTVYDKDEIPLSLSVNITDVAFNITLGLFINDTELGRFTVDESGDKLGYSIAIPEAQRKAFYSISGFDTKIRDKRTIAKSGVIGGTSCVVEDSFNDGSIEVPNVGTWALELRII